MYELFLLGKLLSRPWYGYEFQQALSGFVGPHRRVSWGTVYPLFQRLQREGLIRATARRGSRSVRDRQAYSITAAGKKHFFRLMETEHPHDPNFRETFRIKLGHFSVTPPEVRNQIVSAYMERLAAIEGHTNRMYAVVEQIPGMRKDERTMILRAIDHERSLAEAEVAWMRREMSEFLQNTPPSLL